MQRALSLENLKVNAKFLKEHHGQDQGQRGDYGLQCRPDSPGYFFSLKLGFLLFKAHLPHSVERGEDFVIVWIEIFPDALYPRR